MVSSVRVSRTQLRRGIPGQTRTGGTTLSQQKQASTPVNAPPTRVSSNHAGSRALRCETRTRTGDTTIFRRYVQAARTRRIPGKQAVLAPRSVAVNVRNLPALAPGSGDGGRLISSFAQSRRAEGAGALRLPRGLRRKGRRRRRVESATDLSRSVRRSMGRRAWSSPGYSRWPSSAASSTRSPMRLMPPPTAPPTTRSLGRDRLRRALPAPDLLEPAPCQHGAGSWGGCRWSGRRRRGGEP